MTTPSSCLVIMSKAAVAGHAKTRLIPCLGSHRAAGVYRQLLETTAHSLSSIKTMDVELWCAPNIRHPFFLRLRRQYGYRCHTQPRGDLGRKMAGIFARQLSKYNAVIIVGADCPVMDKHVIQQCEKMLASNTDIVIGAADDGGYALIAMKKPEADLFRGIPWGTSRVMYLTLQRAARKKLNIGIISGLWDVDTPEDYRRWQKMRRKKATACQGNACVS